jgi:REP element-mobilizing transposase RayT
MKRDYVRHLPHQIPDGAPLFLTWNLKGAMPRAVKERLKREREALERLPRRIGESPRDRALRHSKILFAKADDCLDCAKAGPLFLREPRYAAIVEDAILFGAGERYALYSWCVMANHVHMLVEPRWELQRVTKGIKGFTAYEINGLRGERGQALWVDESYDHWVRDEDEMLRIINYIENNPVKAGLCGRPEEWGWSSARFREGWARGEEFRKGTDKVAGRCQTRKSDVRAQVSGWKA